MSTPLGTWVLELVEEDWDQLSPAERKVFADWLQGASAIDLYLLVREAARRRRRSSSVTEFQAVQPKTEPPSE